MTPRGKRNVDRPTYTGLALTKRLVASGIIFICGLDFDHIPKYLFGLTQNGRLTHTIPHFVLYSVIFAALVHRWLFHRRHIK